MQTEIKASKQSISALVIDAGGSFFKSGLISSNGDIIPETSKIVAVDSEGDKEEVIAAYNEIVTGALTYERINGLNIIGIGISTPGPFDYEQGKSLMTHKFQSIYGVCLIDEIKKIPDVNESLRICFLHDAHAFLMGENWKGSSSAFNNVIGITLGTGLGFGCTINKKIKANESGGPYLNLFKQKYKEGILEDRISKRGILKAYKDIKGLADDYEIDVKSIGDMAEADTDKEAKVIFLETGQILGEVLCPICEELAIECIVFGGQISKSFEIMESGLKEKLSGLTNLKKISRAANINEAALIGAGSLFFN